MRGRSEMSEKSRPPSFVMRAEWTSKASSRSVLSRESTGNAACFEWDQKSEGRRGTSFHDRMAVRRIGGEGAIGPDDRQGYGCRLNELIAHPQPFHLMPS
jgi:hypothetical protein